MRLTLKVVKLLRLLALGLLWIVPFYAQFGGNRGLTIVSADYGPSGKYRSVTSILKRMVRNDRLSIQVNNQTLGGDPAPGEEKELIVRYRYRGREDEVRVREGEMLNLPGGGGGQGGYGGFRIVNATYGVGGSYRNVEGILRRMASNDGLTILVTNETMGGDPVPGREKELIVRYELGRRQNETRVREGDTLNLGTGDGGGGGNQYGELRIVSAEYGGSGRYRDVAPRLRGMVQNGRLKVKVTNDNMGGDPAVDVDKKLRVIYDYRGDRGEKEEDEGNTLEIP